MIRNGTTIVLCESEDSTIIMTVQHEHMHEVKVSQHRVFNWKYYKDEVIHDAVEMDNSRMLHGMQR